MVEVDTQQGRRSAKKLKAFIVPNRSSAALVPNVVASVHPATSINSDELPSYNLLKKSYKVRSVCHSAHEFSRQDSENNVVTTNTIEAVHSSIKSKCRSLSLLQGHPTHFHDSLVGKIREIVWRFNSRDHENDLFYYFLTILRLVYDYSLDNSVIEDLVNMHM